MKRPFWLDNLLNFLAGDFFELSAMAYLLAVFPLGYLSFFYDPTIQRTAEIFDRVFVLTLLSFIFFLPALGLTARFRPFSLIRFLKMIGFVTIGGIGGLIVFSSIYYTFVLIDVVPFLVITMLNLKGPPAGPGVIFLISLSGFFLGVGATVILKGILGREVHSKLLTVIGGSMGLLALGGFVIYGTLIGRITADSANGLLFFFGFFGWSYGAAILGSWAAIRESTNLSKAT